MLSEGNEVGGSPSPDEVEADSVVDVLGDQLHDHVHLLYLHEEVTGLGLGAVLQAVDGNVPHQRQQLCR